jgi:hydrogenase maturation protease
VADALVIGLGNDLRGDDGAGLEVARALDAPEVREPAALLDLWDGHDAVVLVDAMRSGARPGTVRRFDLGDGPLPLGLRGSASTHAFGLGDAIELARVLGRLPRRTVVYAVEGRAFEAGTGLSEEVAAAVGDLVGAVLREATA